MKKILFAVVICIALALVFASGCITNKETEIVGTWVPSNLDIFQYNYEGEYYVFYDDGTGSDISYLNGHFQDENPLSWESKGAGEYEVRWTYFEEEEGFNTAQMFTVEDDKLINQLFGYTLYRYND